MRPDIQLKIAGITVFLCLALFSCHKADEVKKDGGIMDRYTLAMVQMSVVGGALDQNLERASQQIRRAAAHGANIALLPEMMDLGWTHPSARKLAYAIPGGKTCRFLCEEARRSNIYICAGIAENDKGTIYNSAVLIDPSGKVILKHRKLNELDIAHDLYAQGDRLGVVHTRLGTIGLHICADASASENTLSKSLGYMGADIILSPSSWAVPPGFNNDSTPYGEPWISAYKEVSSLFDLWIIGVSNVGKIPEGPWKDWDCIGNSLAYAPGGIRVMEAPHGSGADTIIYLDVNLHKRPARGTKWYDYWQKQDAKP
jgi:predicted amidohydrolase